MKRMIPMCLAAALALSACATTSRTSDVSTTYAVASYTVGAADAAYVAAEKVGELAVTSGKLDTATFQSLDTKAYDTLLALRAARTAGIQANVTTASTAFTAAIAALNAYKAN